MWKVVQSEARGPVDQHEADRYGGDANSGREVALAQLLLVPPRLVPLVELLQRPGLRVERVNRDGETSANSRSNTIYVENASLHPLLQQYFILHLNP